MKGRLAIAITIACLSFGIAVGAEKVESETKPGIAPAQVFTITNDTNAVHRLAPNDVVEVKVYLEPDLDAKGVLDENGMINLPLLGAVKIGGKTATEAASYIKKLYEDDYLVQANVNVTVVEFAKRQFTVIGQVQKPGVIEYPALRTLTILEAIGLAGSFTRLADQSNVSVQRTENGTLKIYKIDVKKMLNNPKAQPFYIYPDDVITVGESPF